MSADLLRSRPTRPTKTTPDSGVVAAWLLWVRRKVWVVRWFDELRQNFWFTPLVGAAAGPVLATSLRVMPYRPEVWMPDGDTQRAFSVMVAGTMMAVTASTFTLVMAVLSLASSQFGPRLIRQFLKSGTSQSTLALFLGIAGFHTTALLSAIAAPRALVFYGGLSVAALGVIGLVAFLQHVARSVDADVVVRGVADEFTQSIRALCGGEHHPTPPAPFAHVLRARTSGYFQAVDLIRLRSHAMEHDNTYQVVLRPGQFALEGDPVLRAREEIADDERQPLLAALWFGSARSTTQDLEFAAEQLAEMAVRALSPGINDPYTARRCIDHISDGLLQLERHGRPDACLQDPDGEPRVWMNWPTLDQVRAAGFDRIRHAAADDPITTRHLDDVLARIEKHAVPAGSR